MNKKARFKLEIVGDDYVIRQLKFHIIDMKWRIDFMKESIIFVDVSKK